MTYIYLIYIYCRRWYIIYTWQMLWFASEVPFFIQVTQVLFRNRVWNVKALNWWNLHNGFNSTVRNETHKVRDARWTVHHPRWCWRKRRCSPWCFCHFLSITVMIGIYWDHPQWLSYGHCFGIISVLISTCLVFQLSWYVVRGAEVWMRITLQNIFGSDVRGRLVFCSARGCNVLGSDWEDAHDC